MQSLEQLIGRIVAPAPRNPHAAPAPATPGEPLEQLLARVVSAPGGPQRPAPAAPLHAVPIPQATSSPDVPLTP